MLIKNIDCTSELYTALNEMGMLCTEDTRIRTTRKALDNRYVEHRPLLYTDIERVGYFNPHFFVDLEYEGKLEVWVDEEYINPLDIRWIRGLNHLYGIMPKQYEEGTIATIYYNPNQQHIFSYIQPTDDECVYKYAINLNEHPFVNMANPQNALYYISEGKIHKFDVEFETDTQIQLSCTYRHDIDVILATNLIGCFEAKANVGLMIDSPYSKACYHHIVVDNDPLYPVDARFYPCIKVDKDCIVRVYSDSAHEVKYPTSSRLINYPEFLGVDDPYNSDDEYLKNLPHVDDVITGADTDDAILDKFSRISAYCYRIFDDYPIMPNEQADFIVCDNKDFDAQCFSKATINTSTGVIEKIITNVPFEPHRDIMFYEGQVFSDYSSLSVKTVDGVMIEDMRGISRPVYIIDPQYDVNKFTLIKFNANEDTNFVNVADYVDPDNILELHTKLNRFYRNLMILRMSVLDASDDEVHVSTTIPESKDEHLWFELLVNAIPEKFIIHPIESIDVAGLDSKNIPESVKAGAYRLDMDAGDGPESYSEILMTYFKLARAHKHFLAIQYGEGIDDPRIMTFDTVNIGREEDHEELNAMLIEDENVGPHTTDKYHYGIADNPGGNGKSPGDLYITLSEIPVPPEERNIHVNRIITGPVVPEGDIRTLYIRLPADEGFVQRNGFDSDTTYMVQVNKEEEATDMEIGDFAMDAIFDDLSPELVNTQVTAGLYDQEETMDAIDDLLNDLGEEIIADDDEMFTGDLFEGLTAAVNNGITVKNVKDPKVGMFALDDISYVNSETGEIISPDTIHNMPFEQKIDIIQRYIMDDDTPTDADIGDLWIQYISNTDEATLNTIVEKVLLTKYVYDLAQSKRGDLALEGETLPESAERIAMGIYPQHIYENEMILTPHDLDIDGNTKPDYETVFENNLKYILSVYEPDEADIGTLWIDMPAITLEDYIEDVISHTLYENGYYLPKGYKDDLYASMTFDYDSHGTVEEVGELFAEVNSNDLHHIFRGYYPPENIKDRDVWYEFLDTIDTKICYSDRNTIIIRADERLIAIEFDHENIEAFMFDDIVLNFRGKLGIKYLSILADLVNSGVVKLEDINIFWRRLITCKDRFDPGLKRLYTGTSHIVSTANIDTTDYSIVYSGNIGRFTIDYADETTTNTERQAAYRMVIDYSNRNFAFLMDKMVLFVNGKLIPRNAYREVNSGCIELLGFDEVISCVDILYSMKDVKLMEAKKLAIRYCRYNDQSTMIQRPERDYNKMQLINMDDHTYRGYYDILLHEFILNGRLNRELNYIQEHPDEAHEFVRDFVSKFHDIADVDLSKMHLEDSRIIINANGDDPIIDIK